MTYRPADVACALLRHLLASLLAIAGFFNRHLVP